LYDRLHRRLNRLVNAGQSTLLQGGKKGIEKESLRVTPDGSLAQTPHPPALGSALTHPHITTDYSEAQLELITAPLADVNEMMEALRQIHLFVCDNLPHNEMLWVTSMPCVVHGEQSVPIAEYGSSNAGMFKHVYRRGLDVRYGRIMQAISGIHFNYSVPEPFWPVFQEQEEHSGDRRTFVDEAYFALMRNVLRYEWLITYLFGNSPALCKSFLAGAESPFQEFDAHTDFEPYATSLRMSDIGYKNNIPSELVVSYNHLGAYVADLTYAVQTPYAPYADAGVVVNGEYRQLNANILQIENEYYSSVRPKQIAHSGERPLVALRDRGVRYVELRAVDVNTFEPLGIGAAQARFLEAFLLFCLLQESPPLDGDARAESERNQQLAVHWGRADHLELHRNGREISLQAWASEVLDAMTGICELLDDGSGRYQAALAAQQATVREPERTLSARLLHEMRSQGESFYRCAMRLAQQHHATLSAMPRDPDAMHEFARLARESQQEQAEIEASERESFAEYLARYARQLG